jgi:hypothetical protein
MLGRFACKLIGEQDAGWRQREVRPVDGARHL